MNFKTLRAEFHGETKVLFDGKEFTNFDWLHKVLGGRYVDVNDDLMDGISENQFGEWNEEHSEWSWGLFVGDIKEENYINFIFTE